VVYELFHPLTGRSYIGSSRSVYSRVTQHKSQAFTALSELEFYRDIREFGWQDLVFTILHEGDDYREKEIEFTKNADNCYNLFNTDKRSQPSPMTQETKDKQSEYWKQRILDDPKYAAQVESNRQKAVAQSVLSRTKKYHIWYDDDTETDMTGTLKSISLKHNMSSSALSTWMRRGCKRKCSNIVKIEEVT